MQRSNYVVEIKESNIVGGYIKPEEMFMLSHAVLKQICNSMF